eukprot:TRINITY_DN2584_c0_g1_i1.p1 TRINITY_DN2584_c0_g1~~TRINITY_DN2584_c0_g1_i1.p1  ORF type:complete len:113 (-),score=0.36 TRINITY_DN2584_c0_g1_i1:88-426(-)
MKMLVCLLIVALSVFSSGKEFKGVESPALESGFEPELVSGLESTIAFPPDKIPDFVAKVADVGSSFCASGCRRVALYCLRDNRFVKMFFRFVRKKALDGDSAWLSARNLICY